MAAGMEFPSTHWSLLAQATLHGDEGTATALKEFCRRYRAVVVGFIRRRGHSPADAEDLAHDFLLHVMEKSTLRRADAARGRFRTFLLGSLVRFLGDAHDRRTAGKRGGGIVPLSLDHSDATDDLAQVAPPDSEAFDREWAIGLLELTLQAIESEYAARGRRKLFQVLRPYIPGGAHPPTYEETASIAGLSLPSLKTEIHRLRLRFRAVLRREISGTVSGSAEIDAEIAYLGRVLRGHVQ